MKRSKLLHSSAVIIPPLMEEAVELEIILEVKVHVTRLFP